MKAYGYILIISLVVLASCQKDNGDKEPEYTVDEFVQLVKEGEYDLLGLPKFSQDDIPRLLEYANDFQEIPVFPKSLISSYFPTKFRLGECLLWTIESIKNCDDKGRLQYPSSNPMLVREGYGNDPASGMLNEQELLEVYELYAYWWDSNMGNSFDTFKDVNVLDNSGYHWY